MKPIIFLINHWSLTYYASRILRQDVQRMSSYQQFSTASYVGVQGNGELKIRFRVVKESGKISVNIVANAYRGQFHWLATV